jgi:hypothetical protein
LQVATSVTIKAALFASVALDDVVEANAARRRGRPVANVAGPRALARPQVAARDVPRGVTACAARASLRIQRRNATIFGAWRRPIRGARRRQAS